MAHIRLPTVVQAYDKLWELSCVSLVRNAFISRNLQNENLLAPSTEAKIAMQCLEVVDPNIHKSRTVTDAGCSAGCTAGGWDRVCSPLAPIYILRSEAWERSISFVQPY
jgi:hypothetical protein